MGLFVPDAKQINRSVRQELSEQQHLLGYSLVDLWGAGKEEVHVVSFADRTFTTARVSENRELLERSSESCLYREKRYSPGGGIWLTQEEPEMEQTEVEDRYPHHCFSPDQKELVYSKDGALRIYNTVTKTLRDLGYGHAASWSPDGKWIGFSDGKHYVLLDPKTGTRANLFSTEDTTLVQWSPDARYLTYSKPGGSPGKGSLGGLLFWRIQCPEPWRVWVWRVEDGDHDWAMQICKPGRSFVWLKNSELVLQ